MKVVFVHGWSVTNTDTYGELPEALQAATAADLKLELHHIFLGRYISFNDDVRMNDVALAFHNALKDEGLLSAPEGFACITHSTGGPVVRTWIDKFYGPKKLAEMPLKHLIMLAPANHGSALAQLGKGRLSRIKTWFQGIEPGQKMLDWLELGGAEQLELNRRWLDYPEFGTSFYPVVLSGQTIDAKLYDHLNSYTGEVGSDGVVRLAGANMNYRWVELAENSKSKSYGKVEVQGEDVETFALEATKGSLRTSAYMPLGIIPGVSHSGEKKGIMRSIEKGDTNHPAVKWVVRTLQVKSKQAYKTLCDDLEKFSADTQAAEKKIPHCSMIITRITDHTGNAIYDYDLYLLDGEKFSPNRLPKDFFIDRQRNGKSANVLTYYLNYDKLSNVPGNKLCLRVVTRPQAGVVKYRTLDFRSENMTIDDVLNPNETLIVDIVVRRRIDKEIFRLNPASEPRRDFSKQKSSGNEAT